MVTIKEQPAFPQLLNGELKEQGNGQEVQVRVPEGVMTGEVKSLNIDWIEGQVCSEETMT